MLSDEAKQGVLREIKNGWGILVTFTLTTLNLK